MSYDGCRLKWCEDSLKLKLIVNDTWNLEGKWSSPANQRHFVAQMLAWFLHGIEENRTRKFYMEMMGSCSR
jgi:hypothetical protein